MDRLNPITDAPEHAGPRRSEDNAASQVLTPGAVAGEAQSVGSAGYDYPLEMTTPLARILSHKTAPTIPCRECEGTGFFVSGAFHPDDPRCEATWDCENCGGTGEVEATCDCGEPLDVTGYCEACEDYEFPHGNAGALPDGWARIEL